MSGTDTLRAQEMVEISSVTSIRRPLQRSSVPDLLDRPRSLEDELGTQGFRYIGPQGRSLKATGVLTSCD